MIGAAARAAGRASPVQFATPGRRTSARREDGATARSRRRRHRRGPLLCARRARRRTSTLPFSSTTLCGLDHHHDTWTGVDVLTLLQKGELAGLEAGGSTDDVRGAARVPPGPASGAWKRSRPHTRRHDSSLSRHRRGASVKRCRPPADTFSSAFISCSRGVHINNGVGYRNSA